jgi:hypothetical protein
VTGFADRLGAFGSGQDQAWHVALDILLAGAGAADALLSLTCHTRVAGRSPRAARSAAEFAATAAAVGQQPVARVELVIHSPQALDRCSGA